MMNGVAYLIRLCTYVTSLVKLSEVWPLARLVPHMWLIKLVFPFPQGPMTMHLTGWMGFDAGLL